MGSGENGWSVYIPGGEYCTDSQIIESSEEEMVAEDGSQENIKNEEEVPAATNPTMGTGIGVPGSPTLSGGFTEDILVLHPESDEDESFTPTDTQKVCQAPTEHVTIHEGMPVCQAYQTGDCKFGTKGIGCRYGHPKACEKLLKHGQWHKRGCTRGQSCKHYHPVCRESLTQHWCSRGERCHFQHPMSWKGIVGEMEEIKRARLDRVPPESTTDSNGIKKTYTIGEQIGYGGCGRVYHGHCKEGKAVVIKVIPRKRIWRWFTSEDVQQTVPMEYAMMKRVRHIEGVIKCHDYYADEGDCTIVMEYLGHSQDLFDCIGRTSSGYLSEGVACNIFQQLVATVGRIHEHGIIHRDLKVENILVDPTTQWVHLIDFGAAALDQGMPFTCFEGTQAYAPPEWIEQHCYEGPPMEVWTLGIVLYAMVSGDVPFANHRQTLEGKPNFKGYLSSPVKDLIRKCLAYAPQDRPSIQDIKQHPWMARG